MVGIKPQISFIQFAADNVDNQINTLDVTGTYRGMGISGGAAPGTESSKVIQRDTSVIGEKLSDLGRVPIFYNNLTLEISMVYNIKFKEISLDEEN